MSNALNLMNAARAAIDFNMSSRGADLSRCWSIRVERYILVKLCSYDHLHEIIIKRFLLFSWQYTYNYVRLKLTVIDRDKNLINL